MVLMKDLIEDFLAKRAKWESDYASHDWSKPHFEQVRINGVPQGPKLRQQYCTNCLASYDDNTSVTCTGKPATFADTQAKAQGYIRPGTPPLIDVDALFNTREAQR